MAPCELPFLLALEVAISGWPANSSAGNTQTDPRDEHRQPTVGSATDPWRAAQARHRDRTDQRGQIYGQAKRSAVPRVEDVPPQSCRRHRRDGYVRRADNLVPPALWFVDHGAWQTTGHMVRSNNASDRGMDRKPVHGSLRMGAASPLSDPRSRWSVWRSFHPTTSVNGHSRSADAAAFPMAKRICRTADRFDPTRMPRPRRGVRREPPPSPTAVVHEILQWRPHASILGEGCAGLACRRTGRADPLSPHSRRAAPPICPDLIFDRHRVCCHLARLGKRLVLRASEKIGLQKSSRSLPDRGLKGYRKCTCWRFLRQATARYQYRPSARRRFKPRICSGGRSRRSASIQN